jgi:predicted methyltransferase
MAFDLRKALNAISDVVHNRPKALREFDQIYMKSADMLLQTEHVSKHLDGKRVVFIGDGDAIGLCLIHLKQQRHLETGPTSVHILDFDERIVNSVRRFARDYEVSDKVTAELYNVADPLPEKHWQSFGGFYTNPPFGQSNEGASVLAFLRRGFEAMGGKDCTGCAVIADDKETEWTQVALLASQRFAVQQSYVVAEFLPEFHTYHLDDAPDLTSCSMVFRRAARPTGIYASAALTRPERENFYGKTKPLWVQYVRDHSSGGEDLLQNYTLEKYADDQFNLPL